MYTSYGGLDPIDDTTILPAADYQIQQAEAGNYVGTYTQAVSHTQTGIAWPPGVSTGAWFLDPTTNAGMKAKAAYATAVAARILRSPGLVRAARSFYSDAEWDVGAYRLRQLFGGGIFASGDDTEIRDTALAAKGYIQEAAAGNANSAQVRGILDRLDSMSMPDSVRDAQADHDATTPSGMADDFAEGVGADLEAGGDWVKGIVDDAGKTGKNLANLLSGDPDPELDAPREKWWQLTLRQQYQLAGTAAALAAILYVGAPYATILAEAQRRRSKKA